MHIHVFLWHTSGYIVLRGWCDYPNTLSSSRKCSLDQKDPRSTHATKFKLQRSNDKRICRKDNKMILYFEVEDTGCGTNLVFLITTEILIDKYSIFFIQPFVLSGIDPRKWDPVFESFEQADPSTTRL